MKRTSSMPLAGASPRVRRGFAPVLVLSLLAYVFPPGCGRGAALAAARPRYGGTLRIELRAPLASLDPAESAEDSQRAAKEQLAALAFEGLVRLDESGQPQPQLAVSWQHDSEYRQWQFRLRPGVRFHDGAPLTVSVVAESLQRAAAGAPWRVSVFGQTILVRSNQPLPNLPVELARARCVIHARDSSGSLQGTGPFRLAAFEPGQRARFLAHDVYWGGRPYLDALEVKLGRSLRDQLIALELGQADLIDLAPDQVRRLAQGGKRVWSSAPVELVALGASPGGLLSQKPSLRQALALSIDRAAMHNVLLQRQGELAGSFFPQWVSGIAFLFPVARDLERARELAAADSPAAPIVLVYEAADPLARALAERVAVNAREAGVAVQAVGSGPGEHRPADVYLLRRPVFFAEVAGLAEGLPPALERDFGEAEAQGDPDLLYAAERGLTETYGLIPLFHLPRAYGLSAPVRGWAATRWGDWRLADVWLAPAAESGESGEKP